MAGEVNLVTDYRPLPEQTVGGEIGVDVTMALRLALSDAVPQARIPGTTANRSDRATTILFPRLPSGWTYFVTEPVEVPGDRNLRLAATTPRGARLRSAEGIRHALISKRGRRVHIFENLVLHMGGILIE